MSDEHYPGEADEAAQAEADCAMTDHAQQDVAEQVIRDVHKELPDVWLGGRQRYVLVEAIAKALTQAHAAGRRAGLEELEGQIDQLGDSYFHLGNTQARLAIEAVEKLIAKAKEGT